MLSARRQPHHLNREQPTAARFAKGRDPSRPSSRFVRWRTPVCRRRSQAHTSYFGPKRPGSVSGSRPTMRLRMCCRQDSPRRPGGDAPVCQGNVDLRLDVLGAAGVAMIGQWTPVSIDPLCIIEVRQPLPGPASHGLGRNAAQHRDDRTTPFADELLWAWTAMLLSGSGVYFQLLVDAVHVHLRVAVSQSLAFLPEAASHDLSPRIPPATANESHAPVPWPESPRPPDLAHHRRVRHPFLHSIRIADSRSRGRRVAR